MAIQQGKEICASGSHGVSVLVQEEKFYWNIPTNVCIIKNWIAVKNVHGAMKVDEECRTIVREGFLEKVAINPWAVVWTMSWEGDEEIDWTL